VSLAQEDGDDSVELPGAETFEFEAEVSRLMDIIINALYSNRDIFLRELISNAADALDKIRFMSVSDSSLLGEGDDANLEIKISFDKEAKTITIRDRGVGMTKAELIKNLGVVAKSGTTEFVEAAASGGGDALSLIGQFGVGFYSVYLVADKVVVASKSNNDEQYVWTSMADRTFTVAVDPEGDTLGRGTSITLHIKEDAEEYLQYNNLKKIVARYSEFVNFPIFMEQTETVKEEVPLDEEELAALEAEEEAKKEAESDEDLDISDEEEEEEADDTPKTKTVEKEVKSWVRLNEMKAIWTRSPSEVDDEEYEGFYKALSKDEDAPLSKVHFSAEGEISFRSLLFIPKKAPRGIYDNYYAKSTGVSLYVRRVLISDEFDEFLPYLSFVNGVVDSDDLPINVSRETLAQSRVLKVMSKKLVRKVLEMLRKMSEAEEDALDAAEEDEDEEEADVDDDEEEDEDDEEEEEEEEADMRYAEFWKEFGKSIKLGVMEDKANKSKLTKLLRFTTNLSPDTPISLERYVAGMHEDQRDIYFISGESQEAVQASPMLEVFTEKDLEVLFFVDPMDEYLTQSLTEFEGSSFQSISKDGLKLGDEDLFEKYAEKFEDFTTWFEDTLGDKVEAVKVSPRLATTPAVVVTGQYGWSANMERIMKAQTFGDASKNKHMAAKKTLEINVKNAMIRELADRSAVDPDAKELKDYAELIYDAALVQSGFAVEDSTNFAERLHRIIAVAVDVEPTGIVEVELDETEEEEEEVVLE